MRGSATLKKIEESSLAHYRPILIAKRGELSALQASSASVWAGMKPVLQVAPRERDFAGGGFKKTLEEHLAGLPKKFATATKSHVAFIDLSLMDSEALVFSGRHPLAWLVDEAVVHGLELTPLVYSGSSSATIAAVSDVHARRGSGVGIRLFPADWSSISPRLLPAVMAACGVTSSETDIFIDVDQEFGPVVSLGVLTEMSSQDANYAFRSRSVGGAAFPNTNGLPKGLNEFSREDWLIFRATHRARTRAGLSTPDFFDNAIQNPRLIEMDVDPRVLSISGSFRYTVDGEWLVAKGDLFKGQGGSGIGGASIKTPLTLIHAHPKFALPIRGDTDDWIDSVLAATATTGNPEAWRRWATQRHLAVASHQLASPI